MKRRFIVLPTLMLMLMASIPAGAAVNAQLSASAIAPGDTVQLTLEHTGPGGGEPDLSPLNQDFDVLASSSSSRFEIDNGVASSSTDVTVTLSPKRAGRLTIPSLRWGKDRSPALSLMVSAAATGSNSGAGGAGPSSAARREFLEISLDNQQPLVQAAVHLTVRLYSAETLYHPNLTLGAGPDVLVQQVGEDAQSDEQRDGVTYRVLTRHYLLFPQRSGTLSLAGPVLDAQVADRSAMSPLANGPFGNFFGGAFAGLVTTRPIRLHGQPIVLNVRARPAVADATSYWLPARKLTLTSQWQPAPLRVHAGDPITVHLHLQASDLTAAQLPDLSTLWQLPAGIKAYPDQPQLKDQAQGDSVIGSRDQTIALIADQPGRFTVPALEVHWWDTGAHAARVTSLPAQTLQILPAAAVPGPSGQAATASLPAGTSGAGRAPAAPATQASTMLHTAPASVPAAHPPAPVAHDPWRWISGALAALWLATVSAWAWSSRRRGRRRERPNVDRNAGPRPDLAGARKAVVQACRDGNAPAARQALLAWAAIRWPQAPPRGLSELGRLVDPQLAQPLRELDRACYAGDAWDMQRLLASFETLSAQPGASPAAAHRKRAAETLAPLYP